MATFLVVHPYLDIYGGGERVCHNVIKTLAAHGQKVELLTFDFDAGRYRDIVGEDLPKDVVIHSLGKRIEVEPPFTIYKRHRNFVKLLKKYRDRLEYDYLFSTQSSSPFEPVFLNKAKKNIAYVHFPEIHYDYARGTLKRKIYLWLFKHWVEQGIDKLDMVFCNSNYTKEAIERYWKSHGVKDPLVVYPPVNLDKFWSDKPLAERRKRITYVARFIPAKRHEIMKKLAADLPAYEFVSVGGLIDAEKAWFNKFQENLPPNYTLKTNLPGPELLDVLHDSRIYVHLMEGEHFGIAPIEGLASGCVTIVHNSGGMKEFIPDEFRWETYDDLKQKIVQCIEKEEASADWEIKRQQLWRKISVLTPETFQHKIWSQIELLVP
ncbi:MAG: glycosyltransferase family 4 protein [Chloroflexi bacterium]|nr:glycosyltransferase family 4 protein [Chloroflexota bacterium]